MRFPVRLFASFARLIAFFTVLTRLVVKIAKVPWQSLRNRLWGICFSNTSSVKLKPSQKVAKAGKRWKAYYNLFPESRWT